MTITAEIGAMFEDIGQAESFVSWLLQHGYAKNSRSERFVAVTVYAHEDRNLILKELDQRGGHIQINDVSDDEN